MKSIVRVLAEIDGILWAFLLAQNIYRYKHGWGHDWFIKVYGLFPVVGLIVTVAILLTTRMRFRFLVTATMTVLAVLCLAIDEGPMSVDVNYIAPVARYVGMANASVNTDLIPNSATAIRVGSAILETYMGRNRFEVVIGKRSLRAILYGDTWSIFFYPKDTGHPEGKINGAPTISIVAGGGLPVIELSKHDGQVREIYFSR